MAHARAKKLPPYDPGEGRLQHAVASLMDNDRCYAL
jgi:hypothetical protein